MSAYPLSELAVQSFQENLSELILIADTPWRIPLVVLAVVTLFALGQWKKKQLEEGPSYRKERVPVASSSLRSRDATMFRSLEALLARSHRKVSKSRPGPSGPESHKSRVSKDPGSRSNHLDTFQIKAGAQDQLLGLDIFRWGRGLPREGVGAKKFGMSLESQ